MSPDIIKIIWGIIIPFLGTTLGAACVFFMKDGFGEKVSKGLSGFASGDALSVEFCGGCHVLCGGGGADPQDV